MDTSATYRRRPRDESWFRHPYIGHTPMPSVVNNIFLRYRQNIFCLILSIYWINRFLKVTHCWNNIKTFYAIYFKRPNDRILFRVKKSAKSIDSETIFHIRFLQELLLLETKKNVYTATTHTVRISGARFHSVTVLRRTGLPKRKG